MYADRMTRILLPLASIVALGCTEAATQQNAAVPQAPPIVMVFDGQGAQSGADGTYASGSRRDHRQRDVGDFIVYRFTGSIQKQPTTLTKRIIGRMGDVIEVDYILEQGRKKQAFRVRLSDAPANRDEIMATARMTGAEVGQMVRPDRRKPRTKGPTTCTNMWTPLPRSSVRNRRTMSPVVRAATGRPATAAAVGS